VIAVKDKMQNLSLSVRLTPKASRNAIIGWAQDAAGNRFLKVSVTAVPEKGKANKALIALLAGEWGISRQSIEIAKGATAKNKLLIIKNISEKTAIHIVSLHPL
jgi:uncharacterized protein (TIGR00251 family)